MSAAAGLAGTNANLQFIVTHAGYPLSRAPDYIAAWRAGMRKLAEHDNVAVKLSGFGFIDPEWTIDSLRPIILEAVEIFAPSRCVFASDFPVDKMTRDYRSYWSAL
jgi:predicted TIM-barrel fold metal-dependent hydrolase